VVHLFVVLDKNLLSQFDILLNHDACVHIKVIIHSYSFRFDVISNHKELEKDALNQDVLCKDEGHIALDVGQFLAAVQKHTLTNDQGN
jgi:hypothetical protein